MAKKIQKKQIEDGVFVETKATYSAPTQDNEFVQKKYVDEEVAKKADVSHTHSWTDITNKPRISVTLADTAISRTYTIGLTGANGSSGKLIIPKAVSWNDVTDKPTFPTLPSWVTQTKPVYDWSEIQNKPSLDFIPTSWNRMNGKEIIKTNENNGWLYLDFENSFANGVYSGNKILRTDGQLQVGGEGSVFRTHKEQNNDSIIIGNKIRIKTGEDDSYIAFGNPNWTKLVYGEFAGIKIWNNVDNNKVVLAGGGVTNLSELKNENVKVGGRNLLLKSGVEVSNMQYEIGVWKITEDINLGETVTLTIEGDFAEGCYPLLFASGGDGNLGVLQRGVNVWDNTAKRKISKGQFMHLYIIGNGSSDKLNTVRKIKLEKGNTPTDWSPAPEDLESEIPQYKTITDVHTFLDKDGSIHFGSGSAISNAPSSHFYEMVGFTHSSKQWGFIIAKNIDSDDKRLYVKQVIGGIYKEWFTLEDRSSERTINVTTSTFDITSNVVGQTAHIANDCVLNFNTMPELTTFAVRKVYDGGSVTFSGSIPPIYTGDTVLNGKKGSTAIIDYGLNNQVFIDIRNV